MSTQNVAPLELGWEVPIPLDRRADLPPFPIDALPSWQGAFVEHEAIATQTPADMCGTFVLGAAAAVVQGRAQVEAAPGWIEELSLYCVVLLPPGERKTAVHRATLAPVVELERELINGARREVAAAAALRGVLEKRLEAAKKAAAGQKGDQRDLDEHVRELAHELAETPPPVAPRIWCDDATPESLAGLLADHGSISVISAEGGIFDLMTGRYSNGHPNLDVFLKGHSSDPLRVDRRGRPPEIVERPVLTMALAAQPYVLVKASQSADLGQRGLFDRFAYSIPLSRVGQRVIDPPPVPPHVLDEYRHQMLDLGRSLRALDLLTLRTSDDARGELSAWRTRLEPRRHPDADLGHMQGLASKADGLAVRLAGLLHLSGTLRGGFERPISAETMTSALRLADYFLSHASAVYELIGADPALEGARRLLAWIARQRRDSFSKRDAHAGNRAHFKRADELDDALTLLERHGWIRAQEPAGPKPQGGRPPSPVFTIHPLAQNSQMSHNPDSGEGFRVV